MISMIEIISRSYVDKEAGFGRLGMSSLHEDEG